MEQPSPPRVKIPAAPASVTLDLLDNQTGAPPRQSTRVTLSRTPTHFCVAFQCQDAHPWATITRRGGPLYQEEVVEIFLDPFGDLECYFEIEVNPLNTVLDLMLRRIARGWRKDFAWSCADLETTAAIAAPGWSASLSIPFASITPTPPTPGTIWRANFLRIDRPQSLPRELSAWSPTALNTFHSPAHFGFLEF